MEDIKVLVGKITDAATEARQYKTILVQILEHCKALDDKLKSNQITISRPRERACNQAAERLHKFPIIRN